MVKEWSRKQLGASSGSVAFQRSRLYCNSPTTDQGDDCNFRYKTQSTIARETEMALTGNMITRIFGLPILGVTAAAKKGYNEEIAKYSLGEKGDHYIQMSGYLLAKSKTLDDTGEYNFTVETFTVTKLFIKISTPKILSTSIISRLKFENWTYI